MRLPSDFLDDEALIDKYNQGQVLDSVYYLPQQCRSAWESSFETLIPAQCLLVKNIVFAGMGGSALPGRIIASLSNHFLRLPFAVHSDYHLPGFVGPDTLFFAVSYSGDTEETLNSLSEARQKGAQIFCIGTGGALKEQAKTYSLPGYFFNPDYNPSRLPRLGGGYLLFAALGLLAKCGHLRLKNEQAQSSIHYIAAQNGNFSSRIPSPQNPAKLIAISLKGKLPIFITSGHLLGAAHDFKNQLDETSKTLANLFDLPELNHHLLEGLGFPVSNRANLVFVFIESSLFHPEIKKRIALTKKVVAQNGIEYFSYHARSGKPLTESLEVIQLAGYVSFYLACLNQIDPGVTPWVDYFKKQLHSLPN